MLHQAYDSRGHGRNRGDIALSQGGGEGAAVLHRWGRPGQALKACGQSFLAMIAATAIAAFKAGNQLGAAEEMFGFMLQNSMAPGAQRGHGRIRKTRFQSEITGFC